MAFRYLVAKKFQPIDFSSAFFYFDRRKRWAEYWHATPLSPLKKQLAL